MIILALLFTILYGQDILSCSRLSYDLEASYSLQGVYIRMLNLTWKFSPKITYFDLIQVQIFYDSDFDFTDKWVGLLLENVQVRKIDMVSNSFILTQRNFNFDHFKDKHEIVFQYLVNPKKNQQIYFEYYKGLQSEECVLILNLEEAKLPTTTIFSGGTYMNSPLQVNFQYSHANGVRLSQQYEDFIVQIDFPYSLGITIIVCSDFVGFSDLQYCTASNNGSIYIYNRNQDFKYSQLQHQFKIDNLPYPPNLENYLISYYIYNVQNLLGQGEFTFSATEVSQFDSLTISKYNLYLAQTTNLATRSTQLKLLMLSQYYILAKSDLILELSMNLEVNSITIAGNPISSSQSGTKFTFPAFNDVQLDQLATIIELEFVNPDYMMDITFSLQIINISPCLKGSTVYGVQPNEYASFIVARGSTVRLEATTLKIDIELSNPITNGQILIQFPTELNLPNQIYNQMTGTKFSYTYSINNPSECITGRFESQAYENGKFKEKLYMDVLLTQTPNQLIHDLNITVTPAITASSATMFMSLSTQLQTQILFDSTFQQQSILCYNCTQQSVNQITFTSSSDIIKYITTPRSSKPQIIEVSILQNECSYSTVSYQIDFTPITKKFISRVQNNQLNQLSVWEFILALPIDIYTNDTINLKFPSQLEFGQIQCQFQQLTQQQFDCSKPFQFPQFMGSGFIISLFVDGLQNPANFEVLEWKIEISDNEGFALAVLQSEFQDWQYNTLKYTAITLQDYRFMVIKEAILRIQLQFPADQIVYDGNVIIYCDNCTINQNIVTINEQGIDYLEIPIRFFTIENQRTYSFEYNLTTYLNGAIQEVGFKRQTINLICQDGCNQCQGTYNNCTDCRDGFLFNKTCIETCPTKYYGLNSACYPCTISNCTTCGYHLQKEICIGCSEELDLFNNTCTVYQRTQQQTNTTTTTIPVTENATTTIENVPQFGVTYSFPGILIFIVSISATTLIAKIGNHTSISKTVLLAHFGLLENLVAIYINFYFLIVGPKYLAGFSVSLILYQIFIQQDFLIHLYDHIVKDDKYQHNLKSSSIFKLIHYISICFSYMYFLMFTSQIAKHPKWNCQWTDRKPFYEQLIVSLRNSMIYSALEITVMITTMCQLQQFDSMLLESIGLSCFSMYLNLWHQLKFDNLYDQQEML